MINCMWSISKENLARNPTITYRRNSLDSKISETSPSKTTNRRMSVRFDLNGEVLFAGRIEATIFESNPTFIESSRSSAGFHEPNGLDSGVRTRSGRPSDSERVENRTKSSLIPV